MRITETRMEAHLCNGIMYENLYSYQRSAWTQTYDRNEHLVKVQRSFDYTDLSQMPAHDTTKYFQYFYKLNIT